MLSSGKLVSHPGTGPAGWSISAESSMAAPGSLLPRSEQDPHIEFGQRSTGESRLFAFPGSSGTVCGGTSDLPADPGE